MILQTLDLGKQPLSNAFVDSPDQEEYFYDLEVVFDETYKLVRTASLVPPDKMFNESYPYRSSGSATMRQHLEDVASHIRSKFGPKKLLEIGSNDACFLQHFKDIRSVGIEPCSNFQRETTQAGYTVYDRMWGATTALHVVANHGHMDVVYAANCMCHIPGIRQAFLSVADVLSPTGVFVFEDPYVASVFGKVSYDQIYDEHPNLFSLTAIDNLLKVAGMTIIDAERLDIHGGSIRVTAAKQPRTGYYSPRVFNILSQEKRMRLDTSEPLEVFILKVQRSRKELVSLLTGLKRQGKKIVAYGATSKSATIYNYCKIGPEIIDYIIDTTPAKQGKLSPGMHIPIVPREGNLEDADYAFLGAWNFAKEISIKEHEWLARGGRFITHVPTPRIIQDIHTHLP